MKTTRCCNCGLRARTLFDLDEPARCPDCARDERDEIEAVLRDFAQAGARYIARERSIDSR